jgi:hypothetical protein
MCDKDVSCELVPGKPLPVDVIKDVPLGIKLTVRGFEVPCKINIKYVEGTDLNIYASLKYKNPSKDRNEFLKEGKPTYLVVNNSKEVIRESGPMREDMS